MTFTEANYFAIRNDLLKEEQAAIVALERKYTTTLLTLVSGIAEDIYQDFHNAVELRPFWVNYAPKQRGRAPTGSAVPWGDMGEKTIIARLGRAIERSGLQATHPGVPVGGDARLATTDALIHFDVKLTGPNDRADEIVASPYQISGDGLYWDNGVRNSRELVQGRRASMEFQPQLPPYYVLQERVLLCLTYFLKAVYSVRGLGDQPLDYLELVCVPNGLLLFAGPGYARNTRGLLIPGKDDSTITREKRVRVRLDPLARLTSWRCTKITKTEAGWETHSREPLA